MLVVHVGGGRDATLDERREERHRPPRPVQVPRDDEVGLERQDALDDARVARARTAWIVDRRLRNRMDAEPCAPKRAPARRERRRAGIVGGHDARLVHPAAADDRDGVTVEEQALHLSPHRGAGAVLESEVGEEDDAQRPAGREPRPRLLDEFARPQCHDRTHCARDQS